MKPPVEAPTSSARLPLTPRPLASSALASLIPPRETNAGGASSRTCVSTSTSSPGFAARRSLDRSAAARRTAEVAERPRRPSPTRPPGCATGTARARPAGCPGGACPSLPCSLLIDGHTYRWPQTGIMIGDREGSIDSPESLLPETARSPRRVVSFKEPLRLPRSRGRHLVNRTSPRRAGCARAQGRTRPRRHARRSARR